MTGHRGRTSWRRAGSKPKLRYTAGPLAARLRLMRRFMPAALLDAGLRKDLRLA